MKETDIISVSQKRKENIVKIKVKRFTASSMAEEADNQTVERSRGGHHEAGRGASSSISMDAPQRNSTEAMRASNQNIEKVNSCIDRGSRMTASWGSTKRASDGDNLGIKNGTRARCSNLTTLT